jgi:hypothetical protein
MRSACVLVALLPLKCSILVCANLAFENTDFCLGVWRVR